MFICSCRVNSTANLWIRGRLSPAISQHTHPSLACYFLGTASPSILMYPSTGKRPFQSKSSTPAAKMQYPVQVSRTGQMRLWWNIPSPCLVPERSHSLTIFLKLKRMARAKHCNDKRGTHELSCELPAHKEGSAGATGLHLNYTHKTKLNS